MEQSFGNQRKRGGMVTTKPVYIAVEGVDGSGKSTLVPLLAKEIEQKLGIKPLCVSEPFDKKMDPMKAKAKDYIRDRKKYYKHLPHAGQWIISDRSWASTLAYQNVGFWDWLKINRFIHADWGLGGYYKVLLYLDVPIEVAQLRLNSRGEKQDAADKDLHLQKEAQRCYELIMEKGTWFDRKVRVKDGKIDLDTLLGISDNHSENTKQSLSNEQHKEKK